MTRAEIRPSMRKEQEAAVKTLRARDLMQRDVAYVPPDMRLRDLALFLEDQGIHGAPVVDGSGKLVGVVSGTDLARAVSEANEGEAHRTYFRMLNDLGEYRDARTDIDAENFPGADMSVSEIMSTSLVTAAEETTAGEIASRMLEERVHRILIVEGDTVTGILSTTDLLKAVIDYEAP